MPATRDGFERWLRKNGFALVPTGPTSHRKWKAANTPAGIGCATIVLPGHGPRDVSKTVLKLAVRQLRAAGFSRDVRDEIEGS